MTRFHSKVSPLTYERGTYPPFSNVLNYALEDLSNIQVDGLPEFKAHIAFMPRRKGLKSDRNLSGPSFEPNTTFVSDQSTSSESSDESDRSDMIEFSQFIGEIAGESPSGSTNWKATLSAVEIIRKFDKSGWAPLGVFDQQDREIGAIRDAGQWLDEKSDDSSPTTGKIRSLLWEYMLKRAAQRFHLRLWCPPSGLQVPRGWKSALKPRVVSDNACRMTWP